MMVDTTSIVPKRVLSHAGTRVHAAPAVLTATSATTIEIKPLAAYSDKPIAVGATAPAINWPSPPRLMTPARSAMTIPVPMSRSGVVLMRVDERNASVDPKAPRQSAASDAPTANPPADRSAVSTARAMTPMSAIPPARLTTPDSPPGASPPASVALGTAPAPQARHREDAQRRADRQREVCPLPPPRRRPSRHEVNGQHRQQESRRGLYRERGADVLLRRIVGDARRKLRRVGNDRNSPDERHHDGEHPRARRHGPDGYRARPAHGHRDDGHPCATHLVRADSRNDAA